MYYKKKIALIIVWSLGSFLGDQELLFEQISEKGKLKGLDIDLKEKHSQNDSVCRNEHYLYLWGLIH